jgi:gamma-glutamyl-gamma-aminobutyrate hydrolase PuuD
MSSVNWKLIANKKLLNTELRRNCYLDLNEEAIQLDATHLICFQPKVEIHYTLQEVKDWCTAMCEMGFPVKFEGIKRGYYHFCFALENYNKKLHLISALTLLRYLFEEGLDIIPRTYFEICKAVGEQVDKFGAMQIAHTYARGNSNHSLTNFTVQTVLTKYQFFDIVDSSEERLHACGSARINASWRGRTLINPTTDYKTRYENIINQKNTIKVYVVGGDVNYANWIPAHELVDTLEEATLCLFTGGEDIDPSLYNEPKGSLTSSNLQRDLEEKEIFLKAQKLDIPCLGICRGSQFLCVMAGCRLVQHQENPFSEHEIITYDNKKINITSTHHQAAYPFNMVGVKLLAWTLDISSVHLDGNGREMNPRFEAEIVLYRRTNSLGIQGHPEFRSYQNNPNNQASISYLQDLLLKFLKKEL